MNSEPNSRCLRKRREWDRGRKPGKKINVRPGRSHEEKRKGKKINDERTRKKIARF